MRYLCVLFPSVLNRAKTLLTSHVGEGPLMAQPGEKPKLHNAWYASAWHPMDYCEESVWVELDGASLKFLNVVVDAQNTCNMCGQLLHVEDKFTVSFRNG